jgi:hypothetical protein
MKKLFLYVFLGLLWCNVGFAEQVEFSCKVGSLDLWGITGEDKQRFKKKIIKLLVNTDEMKIYDNSEDDELSVIHGIEYVANLNTGIDTSNRLVPKAIKKTSVEDEKIDKQPIIKTKEELLLEYKEILFKYPLTGAYRDFIELKDGSRITFEEAKNLSERKFLSILKYKSETLYNEYKLALKHNTKKFIENEKKADKANKEKLERKWGKVFNYLSGKSLVGDYNKPVHYFYRGHVYWGGYKRKGFVIGIKDSQVKKKGNLRNFFNSQIESSWTYQFNFDCK